MKFYIHKQFLGTEKHLKCEDNFLSWELHIPENAHVYGSPVHTYSALEEIIKIAGIKPPKISDKAQAKAFQTVTTSSYCPWHMILPKSTFEERLSHIIECIKTALSDLESSGYINTYDKCTQMLKSLQGASIAKVNEESIKDLKLSDAAANRMLQLPTGKFKTEYIRSASKTGRLTCRDKVNVLTLPKKFLKLLKPSFEETMLCKVDFISLEPRFAAFLAGLKVGEDVYQTVLDDVLNIKASRSEVKRSILTALYAPASKLNAFHGGSINTFHVKRIRDAFKVDDLSNLISSCEPTRNHFGRRIYPDRKESHIMYNNFIQSSCVDVALLGFSKFIKSLIEKQIMIIPSFVIHDAMVFEILKDDYCKVAEHLNNIEIEQLNNTNFPLELEALHGN